MTPTKKKRLIIVVVIILLLYLGPISLFKINSEIKINTERDNNGSNTSTITKGHYTGFNLNPKEKPVVYPNGAKITSYFILNLGLFLKINQDIDLKKTVDGIPTHTHFTAHVTIWGLGNTTVKKNYFNKTLQEVLDKN